MRDLVTEAEEGSQALPTAYTAASRWGFDPGTLVDWRYSANAIYRFDQDGRHRFLRLTPCSERAAGQLLAELDFVLYLAGNGFPAALPLPSLDGVLLESVPSARGDFHAVVFEEAPGRPPDLDEMDPARIRLWGASLAQLHLLSADYRPDARRRRLSWREDMAQARNRLPEEDKPARELLDRLSTWLAVLPAANQDLGLIHYDFELDNLPWDGDRFHVIDFDDAAYYWYAADVAFALDDVRQQPIRRRKSIIREFLTGYRQVRSLDPAWEEGLPNFFLLMDLLKYGRVTAAFQHSDPALDPPWLVELRARLDRWRADQRKAFVKRLDTINRAACSQFP